MGAAFKHGLGIAARAFDGDGGEGYVVLGTCWLPLLGHPPIASIVFRDLEEFLGRLAAISEIYGPDFVVSISADAEEKQLPLERKAVSTAIEEVYTGKLSIK